MKGKLRIAGTFNRKTEFILGIQWKAGMICTEETAYAKALQLIRLGDLRTWDSSVVGVHWVRSCGSEMRMAYLMPDCDSDSFHVCSPKSFPWMPDSVSHWSTGHLLTHNLPQTELLISSTKPVPSAIFPISGDDNSILLVSHIKTWASSDFFLTLIPSLSACPFGFTFKINQTLPYCLSHNHPLQAITFLTS